MNGTLRNAMMAVATAAALTLATPALAGGEGGHGMMGGDSGMMMGQGGMGMMKGGRMGGMSGGMMSGGMMMKSMHALDLDEDQTQKMTSIHKEIAETRAGTRVEMHQLHRQMMQEMGKEQPDAGEVGRIFDQMAEKKKSILQQRVRAHNEMMGVLSAEQRQRLKKMKEERREEMMEMMEGGKGMGQGGPMHGDDRDDD